MSPGQAKKLLKCSYPTLHKYVDKGILKARKHPVNGQLILNDAEVLKLASKIDDTNVVLLEGSKAHQFKLSQKQLQKLKKQLEEEK